MITKLARFVGDEASCTVREVHAKRLQREVGKGHLWVLDNNDILHRPLVCQVSVPIHGKCFVRFSCFTETRKYAPK